MDDGGEMVLHLQPATTHALSLTPMMLDYSILFRSCWRLHCCGIVVTTRRGKLLPYVHCSVINILPLLTISSDKISAQYAGVLNLGPGRFGDMPIECLKRMPIPRIVRISPVERTIEAQRSPHSAAGLQRGGSLGYWNTWALVSQM
jgi:hypothetical protein